MISDTPSSSSVTEGQDDPLQVMFTGDVHLGPAYNDERVFDDKVCEAGRVTMDMTMIDVGSDEGNLPQVGDVATLIGAGGQEAILRTSLPPCSGTIGYEILTRLGNRLPWLYVGPSRAPAYPLIEEVM